jgi:hypothetical protein
MIGLISRRQVALRMESQAFGRRIFAENPKQFVKRFQHYWCAWRSEVETDKLVTYAPELVTV